MGPVAYNYLMSVLFVLYTHAELRNNIHIERHVVMNDNDIGAIMNNI